MDLKIIWSSDNGRHNTTQKIRDLALKTEIEFKCSGMVSNSCFTSGTCHVTHFPQVIFKLRCSDFIGSSYYNLFYNLGVYRPWRQWSFVEYDVCSPWGYEFLHSTYSVIIVWYVRREADNEIEIEDFPCIPQTRYSFLR